MPMVADRCKETTTTVGTGAITLAGAATGFLAFASCFGNPTVVYYAIIGTAVTTEWEVGIGTFTTTLSRDTVLASSNSGALVNFSAGAKDVFPTIPALFVTQTMQLNTAMIYQMYSSGNDVGAL